jgi:hypothetical protein
MCFKILFSNFPGISEENHEKISQAGGFLNRIEPGAFGS